MIYLGEWERVRNFNNHHFKAPHACAICERGRCDGVWYSARRKEARCYECFDAETEHWALA